MHNGTVDTPMSCGSEGGGSDCGAPPPACDRLSSMRTELSGPSTDNPFPGRDAGATSVGATVPARKSSKSRRKRKGRFKPKTVRPPRRGVEDAGGQPPGERTTENGIGHWEDRTHETESPAILTNHAEEGTEQGTAEPEDYAIIPDSGRLAADRTETIIKVFQINAARSKLVTHQIDKFLESKAADICLIQEPATDGRGVYLLDRLPYKVIATGRTPKAAIVVVNQSISVLGLRHLSTEHNAVAAISMGNTRLTVISSYFQFSDPTQASVNALQSILDEVSGGVIVCADVNARSTVWHDIKTDNRGDIVVEFISQNDITVQNRPGYPPTFRNRGTACLDVTLTLKNVRVANWSATHDLTSSDHALISFDLITRDDARVVTQETVLRYNWSRTNWVKFRKTLKASRDKRIRDLECPDVDVNARAISAVLKEACDAHMKIKTGRKHRPPPWWNGTLDRELSILGRWKARLRNSKNTFQRKAIRRAYIRRKTAHKRRCFKARKTAWRDFVTNTGNKEPWGPVFNWLKSGGIRPSERLPAAIRRNDGSYTATLRETGERLIEALVPGDNYENESPDQIALRAETGVYVGTFMATCSDSGHIGPCDEEEVREAIWRMSPNKSPGGDGITAKILRQSWPVLKKHITSAFNNCLRTKKFPDSWKNARLVIILKATDKDPSEAKSYRPISLLPVISKALEHIIVNRIRNETDAHVSRRQFGFTKNLSTVDAIQHVLDWSSNRQEKYVHAVFLDISGAFDCLWWAQLVKDMKFAHCSDGLIELTKSYLDGRQAELTIGDQTITTVLTKGCPQGSGYGPDLWRYAVNPLLSENLPEGTEIVAYADDLALLISGKNRAELTARGNALLSRATRWASERKLVFSAPKSQTFWLKGSLSKPLDLRLGGTRIKPTINAKYLGITFDQGMKFSDHLAEKAKSTNALFGRLHGIAKTKWGLKSNATLRLYKSVFIPQMGYAASIWAHDCMSLAVQRSRANSAHRLPLRAITGAYNTISTVALQVLAGVPPLDLKLVELARVEADRTAVKNGLMSSIEAQDNLNRYVNETLDRWQREWVTHDKGRWTFAWFPNVRTRLERTWCVVDYYTAQLMSGHGDFNGKLHQFTLRGSADCRCGSRNQTAEHLLYDCPIADHERKELEDAVRATGADWPCVPEYMTRSEVMFQAVKKFAHATLSRTDGG